MNKRQAMWVKQIQIKKKKKELNLKVKEKEGKAKAICPIIGKLKKTFTFLHVRICKIFIIGTITSGKDSFRRYVCAGFLLSFVLFFSDEAKSEMDPLKVLQHIQKKKNVFSEWDAKGFEKVGGNQGYGFNER